MSLFQVEWSGASAQLGNELTPTQVAEKPSVAWQCDPRKKYTLVFFDLDVLGKDNRLVDEGRLWLVVNITDCDWRLGETVVDLLSPTPLYGSGKHRYVFLVYEQEPGVYFEEPFVDAK